MKYTDVGFAYLYTTRLPFRQHI